VEEVHQMRELASVGAAHAATAFAQLVGRTIVMRVPKVRGLDPGPEEDAASAEIRAVRLDPAWSTGVLFEFEGCLGALVGVFFQRSVRDVVVRRVLGEPDGCLPPGSAEAPSWPRSPTTAWGITPSSSSASSPTPRAKSEASWSWFPT